MSEFTQGICGSGVAILRDGIPVSIDEIVNLLNKSESNSQKKPYPQALREAMDAAFAMLDSGGLPFGWRDASPANMFRLGFDAGMGKQGQGEDGTAPLLAAVDALLADAEEWRSAVICSDSVTEALEELGGKKGAAIVTEKRIRDLAIARRKLMSGFAAGGTG